MNPTPKYELGQRLFYRKACKSGTVDAIMIVPSGIYYNISNAQDGYSNCPEGGLDEVNLIPASTETTDVLIGTARKWVASHKSFVAVAKNMEPHEVVAEWEANKLGVTIIGSAK